MRTYEAICVRCQRKLWPYCETPPTDYICKLCLAHAWKPKRATGELAEIAQKFMKMTAPFRVKTDLEGVPYIIGKYGRIEPHNKHELAVYTENGTMRARLVRMTGIIRHQMGEDEFRFRFPVDLLPKVAEVIQARRRRMGSPHGFKARA